MKYFIFGGRRLAAFTLMIFGAAAGVSVLSSQATASPVSGPCPNCNGLQQTPSLLAPANIDVLSGLEFSLNAGAGVEFSLEQGPIFQVPTTLSADTWKAWESVQAGQYILGGPQRVEQALTYWGTSYTPGFILPQGFWNSDIFSSSGANSGKAAI